MPLFAIYEGAVSVEASIRRILAVHVDLPASDEAPLLLPSLVVIVLVEELEREFGFRVPARELVPDNFGSVARLAAFVRRKAGA